ncbi:MAG: hypothetical protein WCO18_01300 [bacterium]
MNNENNPERLPEYTSENFQEELENSKNSTELFLNNLFLNLPLKEDKGAIYRDAQLGRSGWPKRKEIPKRSQELSDAIDNFCNEKGIDFGEMTSQEIMEKEESFLTDLYIYLRNKGFSHQEITT